LKITDRGKNLVAYFNQSDRFLKVENNYHFYVDIVIYDCTVILTPRPPSERKKEVNKRLKDLTICYLMGQVDILSI